MPLYETFIDNPDLVRKYIKQLSPIEKMKMAIYVDDYGAFKKYYERSLDHGDDICIFLIENDVLSYMIKYLKFNRYLKYLNYIIDNITEFDENLFKYLAKATNKCGKFAEVFSDSNYKYIEPIINYMLENDIEKMEWFMDIMCLISETHHIGILSIMKIGETSKHMDIFMDIMNGVYRCKVSNKYNRHLKNRITTFLHNAEAIDLYELMAEIINKIFTYNYNVKEEYYQYSDWYDNINKFMKHMKQCKSLDTLQRIFDCFDNEYDMHKDTMPFIKAIIKTSMRLKQSLSFEDKMISTDHIYNIQLGDLYGDDGNIYEIKYLLI